ncbi:MAG: hypothetical protein LC657_19905, partial [Desulfobacteraceae bacterium]|nr:hypothetical protein [Desulfobacteraceae bacterium]
GDQIKQGCHRPGWQKPDPMAFQNQQFPVVDSKDALYHITFLPITHAAGTIRSAAFGLEPPVSSLAVLTLTGGVLFYVAVLCVKKARD